MRCEGCRLNYSIFGKCGCTYPFEIFPGGRMMAFSPTEQYRPIVMTTCCPAVERRRSPRSMAPGKSSEREGKNRE